MVFHEKRVLPVTFLYIYIPIIIFVFGFLKIFIALPIALILGIITFRGWQSAKNTDSFNKTANVNKVVLVEGILFLLLIGYTAGLGRWTNQAYDWFKHNAILSDLIKYSWPVYFKNGKETSMLTYYFGHYLVPAIFGKITGSFRIAEIVLFIWSEVGLILVWLNLIIYLGKNDVKAQIFELLLLAFFCVPFALAQVVVWFVYRVDCFTNHNIMVEGTDIRLQFSGCYKCIRWVTNQTIVPWLITLMFLKYKDNIRYYLLYMIPGLLFGPLPMVGLAPIAVEYVASNAIKKKRIFKILSEVFSIDNIACLLSLGTVLILYYYGNIVEKKPAELSFSLIHYGNKIGIYFIFIICNVLLSGACICYKFRKEILFYLVIGELIILPLFRMGFYNDLVMRASIPALFMFMCMQADYMMDEFPKVLQLLKDRKKARMRIVYVMSFFILTGLMINGISYEMQRVEDSFLEEDYSSLDALKTYGTMSFFANRDFAALPEEEFEKTIKAQSGWEADVVLNVDLVYNYFSYDVEKNIFCKYLAKRLE